MYMMTVIYSYIAVFRKLTFLGTFRKKTMCSFQDSVFFTICVCVCNNTTRQC